MRRLATFPTLFLLGLGCFVAAVVGVPHSDCGENSLTSRSQALIAIGVAFALGSVVLPWLRYVRGDGGRVGIFVLLVGVVGGALVAGLLTTIDLVILLHTGVCD